MSWISDKLLGYRQILFGGNYLPQRGAIAFVGGVTAVDNPTTGMTDVSVSAADIFVDATNLAVPGQIVKRAPDGSANFGGTCHLGGITCSGDAAITGAMSCHDGYVVADLTVGGGILCGVLETTDIAAGGSLAVTGPASVEDLTCTSIYSAGNAVIGGAATVGGTFGSTGSIATGGGILAVGNIATTTGGFTCPGAATVGTISCAGAASVASLTSSGGASIGGAANVTGLATVGSMTCSGTASMGSLNCIGSAILGGATSVSNVTVLGTNRVKLASRSITRAPGSIFVPFSSGWSWVTPGAVPFPVPVTTVAAAASGWFALSLPDGCVITAVTVWVTPASGHAGLPATMPVVALYQKDTGVLSNGTQVLVHNDSAASVGAYQATHAITATGSVTVDRESSYYVITVVAEGGTNALAGFRIEGATVTFATTSMDDGYCG